MNDGNDIAELGLKSRVKICAALQCAETVTVCELGEDSDIAAVFKLGACDWQSPLVKIEWRICVEELRTCSHD